LVICFGNPLWESVLKFLAPNMAKSHYVVLFS
jgi:hypothetical protein